MADSVGNRPSPREKSLQEEQSAPREASNPSPEGPWQEGSALGSADGEVEGPGG